MMSNTEFRRTINPGKVLRGSRFYRFTADIILQNGVLEFKSNLSFNRLIDFPVALRPGFSTQDLNHIFDIWSTWRHNELNPGTPRQMALVRPFLKANPNSNYDDVCNMLSERGMLIDDGYRYGTDWLFEPVPNDVLEYLFSLPGSGHTWEDVKKELMPNEVDVPDESVESFDLEAFFTLISS